VNRELFVTHARLEDRHWWFTARREILRQLVAAVAPPRQGLALADVGCGTGGNAAAFAADYRVLGLDPSPDAIALARERFPGVTFERADDPDAIRRHLAGGGAVICTDVLEHVEDDRALFDRIVGALPVGAHLVLTVPANPALWSGHDEIFGHFRRYQPETLRALWRDAPVEVRLMSPFNSRLYPVIRAIRALGRGRPPRPHGDLGVPAGPFNAMLHRTFAGEAGALVAAIDRGRAPFARGVSLVAILRRI
jgi:SAM-dependent methyltransferase